MYMYLSENAFSGYISKQATVTHVTHNQAVFVEV